MDAVEERPGDPLRAADSTSLERDRMKWIYPRKHIEGSRV